MLTNGSAETIDVRSLVNTPDYLRSDNLLDPLFFQVPGGTAPGLATSAEPNSDATIWTLKLRDGVTWHDGKPFNADDVVFTIKTWGTKASGYSPVATSIIDFKNVRKLDRLTVQVGLVRPLAAFPAVTSWFNAYVVPDGTTDFNRPIGTGPFRFQSFTPGSSSTFLANPDYWRGRPYVDQLVVDSSFTDDPARVNALLSGQIDIAPLVPPALALENAKSGQLILGNEPGPAFLAVTMRVDVPPFNDPRVVQACKLLTNREAFVADAFDGYATPGNDCVGATLQYWASDIKPAYDPDKAKFLLKAAGQEHLTIPLLDSATVPGMLETGTIWSAQAQAAGVNAPLKLLSPSVYYTSSYPGYTTKQRPLSVNYWNVIPPALGAFYLEALSPSAQFPETGWGAAPGRNTLLDDALGETDPAKAEVKWHAVQEQQAAEGGYIIVANFNYLDAYAPNLHGVVTDAAGNVANYTFYKTWIGAQ
jgi:peptide/nickel transport system substrate-binding protein